MRGLTFAATFAGLFYGVIAVGATSAEAARCAKGSVYRPSLGVCQTYRTAKASGARIYSRYAKASIKHRYKRPPVKRAAAPESVTASNYPPPTPPWKQKIPTPAPQPRPDWLEGVDLFDNFNAIAWAAQDEARAALFGGAP